MKGICFKEELFHKTIEGSKTQTRRIIPNCDSIRCSPFVKSGIETWHGKELKPRYKIDETIYLKEPWNQEATLDNSITGFTGYKATGKYLYKYSGDNLSTNDTKSPFGKWKSKRFMPQSAARYFIKITGVRAERLQNISNEDSIKEGIVKNGLCYFNDVHLHSYITPKEAYANLIDIIIGNDTWKSNPFVWVYDYDLTVKEL